MPSNFVANNAQAYKQAMGRWSERLAVKFINFLQTPLAGSVLDVGCGTGSLVSELQNNTAIHRIVGMDYSAAYVDFAKKRFSDPRIMIEQGDACALPYADASFDAALSLLVLKFVSDPHKAIKELKRVVRRGGMVAAANWDLYGGVPVNRMFWDTATLIVPEAGLLRAKHFSLPLTKPGQFKEAWLKEGLMHVVEDEITICMDFNNFSDYWEPISGGDGPGGQFVVSLTPQRREEFRLALLAAYKAGGEDGPRSFACTAIVCRGVVQ